MIGSFEQTSRAIVPRDQFPVGDGDVDDSSPGESTGVGDGDSMAGVTPQTIASAVEGDCVSPVQGCKPEAEESEVALGVAPHSVTLTLAYFEQLILDSDDIGSGGCDDLDLKARRGGFRMSPGQQGHRASALVERRIFERHPPHRPRAHRQGTPTGEVLAQTRDCRNGRRCGGGVSGDEGDMQPRVGRMGKS
eukprot:CAMPEP_0113597334 /NCGR_PEP_ID=MMETSP0015_2-20120614/40947_1 /TAXON_ID=2838 /ORGANISM="Odontella" /LENGTH=191 /DNA_ID=CAMNT_0000505175 /DNA_START=24 /DNA_END=597 /DNA_ORIENTATION=- /assembly_acc=CAM_ASM_000160